MVVDKLAPSDPRATHHTAVIRGKTYHYLLAQPDSAPPAATILLLHGFPDLSLGWRYQVPLLTSLGLQVVVPDLLGYGQTDAPDALEPYAMKSMAADMAELVRRVVPADGERVILGGHDWGGALVWRMALWHPDLVRGVFSVCTPYAAPSAAPFAPLEAVVQRLPNFRYQVQLAGPDVAAAVAGPEPTRQFLSGMYGGRGPAGEPAFDVARGVLLENLAKIGPSPLLSGAETDFYVAEFLRHGLHGPTNWYRTRRLNYDDELALLRDGRPPRIAVPSLMV